MIYCNNAATTWPKPEIVYETVDDCFRNMNSPERTAGQEGQRSAATMQTCRQEVAEFFGIMDPSRLVFLPSCTYALNLAILCQQWQPGDEVVMSGLEHHAVSRPIRKISREQGVEFSVMPYRPGMPADLDFLEERLQGGRVKMVASTMASNVTGEILPSIQIGKLCQKYGVRYLVDAAQSAGVLPVNVDDLNADFLSFAGHKGLFGPPGVGGLFVREGILLKTLAEGGTGKDSGKHSMSGSFPSNFEVGTHNLLGIVGVTAGTRWVNQAGLDQIRQHEQELTGRFMEGIRQIPNVVIYGTDDPLKKTSVVSFNIKSTSPQEIATLLADRHQIITRAGYHCAPLAHETIGTIPGEGTIRFSFGFSNSVEEIDRAVSILAELPKMVGMS